MKFKNFFTRVLFCFVFCVAVFAKKTPVENLYRYELENGLTLFTFENHTVPLVYIDIEVRAGAVTQSENTAGLFHLYEHMIFKGNSLYPDAASVNNALNDLGVSNWNGATGVDMVKYFFTIPASEIERGLAFWNAAIRFPLLDEKELENEKKVVLAEIEGDLARPGAVYSNFLFSHMFPDRPYLTDPAGNPEIIKSATVDDLKAMKRDFYIPSNAALFIGGDIQSDEVFELVKKIFGTWQNNGQTVSRTKVQASKNPLEKKQLYVLPYNQIQKNIANVEVVWRAPDADFDIADTYPADYLVNIVNEPQGTLKKSLFQNQKLGIVQDASCIWGGYGTKRQNGLYEFGAIFSSPEDEIWNRADAFQSEVQKCLTKTIFLDEKNFSRQTRNLIVQKLNDQNLAQSEVSSSILSTISFWWTCADEDYAFSYIDKMKKVSKKDVQKFCASYFFNNPAVFVMVHPDIVEEHKDEFLKAGYEIITSENALWWKQDRFAFKKGEAQKVSLTEEELYVPSKLKSGMQKKTSSKNIKTLSLKNGIPVYVQSDKGVHVNSLAVVVKGGIARLQQDTSGLESFLFSMMSQSSKKYDRHARDDFSFTKGVSFGSVSKVSASALTLNSLDSYFYDSIEVLADGFMNPDYDEQVYSVLMTEVESALQKQKREPESYLSYEIDKALFENHPYKVKVSATEESFKNITIENLKEHHKTLLNPDGIIIVACGNIDEKKLVKILNKNLGTLNDRSFSVINPLRNVEPPFVGQGDVHLKSENAKGTGFAMNVHVTPEQLSPDYVPFAVASNMYGDTLFSVVREHYGACYSVFCNFIGSRSSYGGEYVYQISDIANFKSRVEEAKSYMARGMMVSGFDKNGVALLEPLSNRLESYKNKFITSTYASSQTSAAKAFSIWYNILQFDDIDHDEKNLEALYKVSEDDVITVFNRYIGNARGRWFLVTGNLNAMQK